MKQKVSVVIPVHNEIKTVEKLIIRLSDALLAAGYPFELIFIDDSSTDGTFEYLHRYNSSEHIKVYKKNGKRGKSYSLVQGFEAATGQLFVMIDGDLQYPPEEIPHMLAKLKLHDIVVANRKKYKAGLLRRTLSRGFRYIFGKVGFGLSCDVQSGLKVFTRDVFTSTRFIPKAAWAFDLEFLHRANHMGYTITGHDITFEERSSGASKINVLSTSFEIGLHALMLRSKPLGPLHIPPLNGTMIGAGVGYKRKRYITHTTLPHHQSALRTFTTTDKVIIFSLLALLATGLVMNAIQTAIIAIAILSFIYFVDVIFNLFVILKSLYVPQEITFDDGELNKLDNAKLPSYTILCPLFREAHVVPQFLSAIEKLDYPKDKLDVMLLLEEDDKETIDAVRLMNLPKYVRIEIVPHSMPKTKPKACNYGLSKATGEYLVIYDAEDIPDPLQLKKAYHAFQKSPREVICLQAKLNYYNPHQNLLTRFFTAEYSLWFDVTLPGLQSLKTSLPLGGTSNHFRTKDLRALQGWDPFNVTEDADLGIRLFNTGYKTAMIDSTTLEEANSSVRNWIRQRSRWIKGYMQTYLVHMKHTLSFTRKHGYHAFIFHLIVGGKIAFILINPILWVATISYFALYEIVGPTIESFYPAYVFYMAATSLVFGNFLFLYYYMIGLFKREQYSLIKFVYLVPLYWILLSIAGSMALYQLIFKPHYWEKTVHGLHLKKEQKRAIAKVVVALEESESATVYPKAVKARFIDRIGISSSMIGSMILVAATVTSNILNLVFSTYFGRVLSPSDFGLLSLIRSFWFFASIPFAAVGITTNSRAGFLDGRYGSAASYSFWSFMRTRTFFVAAAVSTIWIAVSPFLVEYFKAESVLPFLVFSPIWLVGFAYFVDRGLLSAKLHFAWLGIITIIEAGLKLGLGIVLYEYDPRLVYTSIPVSFVISVLIGWAVISFKKAKVKKDETPSDVRHFPKKFFFVSTLSGLSTLSFLSLDVMLAKHYLSPTQAGYYGLLSLVGSMVFFMGTLASQFIVPLVSREDGEKKSSKKTLYMILGATALLSFGGFVLFGLLAEFTLTLPFLLGNSIVPVLQYVPFFAFAMFCFVMSRVFVTYYLTKRSYTFPIVAFILAIVQFLLIDIYHQGIESFVIVMLLMGGINFILMIVLHLNAGYVKIFEQNIVDFFSVFTTGLPQRQEDTVKVLILNWRDKRHVWAGGAEVYVHEIAKRWVEAGMSVTVFCGNDGKSPRNQIIDNVQIIRRGGTYTVYVWAFLYYVLRLRGKYDVIIDCENGIPFFSPLYARKQVFLLIHHVHQEVFRQHLMFPFSVIAGLLEGKLMPFVYRNKQIVTVSESSKLAIIRNGIAKNRNISIIQNGIDISKYPIRKKSIYPLFTYLGRLKAYKNIDIAIYAFARLVKDFPTAKLAIVGSGEMGGKLAKLSKKLGVDQNVTFYGQVDEKTKADILGRSWACLQPSMMEGFGITVIEANAAGTPVIASNVPGLMDAVVHRKTGFLVEAKNAEKMYKVMFDISTNEKLRERLSQSARAWAQNFNWDDSAKQFLKLIIPTVRKRYQQTYAGQLIFSNQKYE